MSGADHDGPQFRTVKLVVHVSATVPAYLDPEELELGVDVNVNAGFAIFDRSSWVQVDSGYPESVKRSLVVETVRAAWEES